MGPKLTIFLMFSFMLCTIVSMTLEGAWYGSDDVDIMNELTGYSVIQLSGAGFWTVAKMGVGFLTIGLPKALIWDYSFLQGDWALLRWMLIGTLSVGFIWGIAQFFISAIQGIFSKFF